MPDGIRFPCTPLPPVFMYKLVLLPQFLCFPCTYHNRLHQIHFVYHRLCARPEPHDLSTLNLPVHTCPISPISRGCSFTNVHPCLRLRSQRLKQVWVLPILRRRPWRGIHNLECHATCVDALSCIRRMLDIFHIGSRSAKGRVCICRKKGILR